jgi:hypothetical protein
VPIPPSTFLAAHGVLQFVDPAPRDPARDELFIASVRQEFPNVLNRTFLPVETPAITPHLTLASKSAQLAVSSVQADFQVRFYGDYVTDIERGLEYVERKLDAVLRGLEAIDVPVGTIGLIATMHFSFSERDDESPALHVLRTHLRASVDESTVQDALARIAVRVRDTYFVTLTLSNYETRVQQQPLMPGLQFLRVRPWEGRLEDTGLELVLDINNNLEARVRGSTETRVTSEGIRAVARMLREIALSTGPGFVETGSLSVEDLTASSTG